MPIKGNSKISRDKLEELESIKRLAIDPSIEALKDLIGDIKTDINDLKNSFIKNIDEIKECYEKSRAIEEQQWTQLNNVRHDIKFLATENIQRKKEVESIPRNIKADKKWKITTIIALLTIAPMWIKELWNIIFPTHQIK